MFEAKIILDSIAPQSRVRLTTMQVTYPRFIHAQILTHRQWSRNSASSRAIPTKKLIKRVQEDTVVPVFWGKNKRGMSPTKEIDCIESAKIAWLSAKDCAVDHAKLLYNLGVHKQIVNRLLEPFQYITAIITATQWSNFYALRCHEDAQQEITLMANMMRDAQSSSVPTEREWHMPYLFDDEEIELDLEVCKKISVARCARVSYLTQEGKRDIDKDIILYNRLIHAGHWCYDKETEILTSSGWKSFYNLLNTDEVASFNIDSGTIQWEKPNNIYSSNYSGKMYKVSGQSVDLVVTPNHRMIIASRKNNGSWTDFRFVEAEVLNTSPVRYIKSGLLDEKYDFESLFIKNIGLNIKSFYKLIGFFAGDGSCDSSKRISFNIRRKRKKEYLAKLNLPFRVMNNGKHVLTIDGIGSWFRENCFTVNGVKKLPDFIFKLSKKKRDYILDGLKNSDGSKKRKTWSYSSTSKILIDQLQILLHIDSQSGNVKFERRINKNHNDLWRLIISNRISPRVEINQANRSKTYSVDWIDYEGDIFCVNVSTGAILVRRNGIVVASGNSPTEHVAKAHEDANYRSGNFRGWTQYRKMFENECR